MKTTKKLLLVLILSMAACSGKLQAQIPLGTGFTYQGFLMDSQRPANREYDFEFRLFDDSDPDVGNQIGGPYPRKRSGSI